jgi:catechol 2,3-dioxygenase
LGHVHLVVNSLDRQIAFYTQVLGFTLHWRDSSEAALGTASEVLLRLTEEPAARRYQHTTGMYHFAILYPDRKALARGMARLFAMRYPNAPTDHGVSMTTYLDDLEGNTIELYIRTLDRAVFDFSGSQPVVRYADGHIGSGRDPLDVEALFADLDEGERLDLPLPDGTRIGHMHLYAASLTDSMHFYRDILGFEEGPMIESFRMGEVGLSEDQPHVVAFNTWKGSTAPPAPADALGIRHYTIVPPDTAVLDRMLAQVRAAAIPIEETPEGLLIKDPSHVGIILTTNMFPIKRA